LGILGTFISEFLRALLSADFGITSYDEENCSCLTGLLPTCDLIAERTTTQAQCLCHGHGT